MDIPPATLITPPAAEIIVTGSALPAPPGAAAYSGITLGRERLTGTASGRIEDALRDVAGLAAFRRTDSRSANPTSQGVTLRALGGNAASRALVLLDGVPVADPFAGYIPWSAIDPARLASVRITRGGGAGAFGAGAVAGTLELASAGPNELAPVSLALAGGSRNSLEASGGLAVRLGGGFVTVSARHDSGDGYFIVPENQRGAVDIPARYESWGGSIRAVVPVAAQTEVQASIRAFDDQRVRGQALVTSESRGADASIRLIHRGNWGAEALAYVQVREFESRFSAVAAGRATATPSLDQFNTPATGVGGKIAVRPPLGSAHSLEIGLDARRGSGSTNEFFRYQVGAFTRLREAGGATSTIGGYIEDSWEVSDAFTLTGGVRGDRWSISAGRLNEFDLANGAPTLAIATAARSGWRGTARGGAIVRLVPSFSLRAAAYTGFRLPTPNELYRPFRVGADATAPNPDLALERTRGIEAGFDWRPLPSARLSLTGFSNELRGAISNVTLGRGPGVFPLVGFVANGGSYRQRLNLDSVLVRGVEADGEVQIGRVMASASIAWSDPKVRASGLSAALDGLRPAASPQFSGSATLGYTGERVRGAVTLRHIGAQFDDDQNLRRLPPATTVDASARLAVTKQLSLEVRAENIGDELIVSGVSADGIIDRAQPRTFWVGLRWEG